MTWADIIGNEFPDNYYNYGKSGCGNGYIFASMVEANTVYQFTDDDLIIVMWSGVDREDRYINGSWKAAGCVYHSIDNFYDKAFTQKYSDLRGYLIRDLNYISAIDKMFTNVHHLSMMPLTKVAEFDDISGDNDVYNFYQNILSKINKSVFEVIYNSDWGNRQKIKKKVGLFKTEIDLHPTPKLHLEYLQKTFPDIEFSLNTLTLVDDQENKLRSTEYFDPNEYPYYARKHIDRL